MRNIIVSNYITLDSFFAGPNGEIDWFIWDGSGSIVSAFTQLGLIDDYRIFVNPIILGTGKPLFKNLTERMTLKLMKTKTFKSGVVLLHYNVMKKVNNND